MKQPTSTPCDVVTFGESMAMFVANEPGDLAAATAFTKRIAGADSNVAIGLARLGLSVNWVSRVGDDSLGRFIRATLEHENVICHIEVDKTRPTGFQVKERAVNGADPLVEYHRKGSAASRLSVADFNPETFLSARHLHTTGIPPALSPTVRKLSQHAMRHMRAAGKTVSFDPNLRPSLWGGTERMVKEINRLAALAHWVLPGLAEGEILTGYRTPRDVAAFYLDLGVEVVVIKLGPEGAYFQTADGEEGTLAAAPVKRVVDTVGAGDGFAAGFISARLEGLNNAQAVARANLIGAMAIQVTGDMEGLPTREELESAERLQFRSPETALEFSQAAA